jgi:hypothetical protein
MKHCWMVCLLSLSACSAFEQQQATLDQLSRDLDQVRDQLEATQASADALSATQTDQKNAMALQIDRLSTTVSGLPALFDATCERHASAPVPECVADGTIQSVVTSDDKLLAVVTNDDKLLVGELEHIWVDPPGMKMVARIDTGAQSSSLTAENLLEFERDGDDWVRFDVIVGELSTTLEREVVRYVRVFQQADPEGSRRPVVSMRLHLGNVQDSFEFTLADRSHLEYQSILGRNFLTDIALVDVGRQFVQPAFEPGD